MPSDSSSAEVYRRLPRYYGREQLECSEVKRLFRGRRGIQFEDPTAYFPYIDHELDRGRDLLHLRDYMIGDLFERSIQLEDRQRFYGPHGVFREADLVCPEVHHSITRDPNAVQLLIPRHRSLFDYAINQPIHHDVVNDKIILAVGQNLMVHKFNESLRHFGGFVFLRDDAILERRGMRRAFLEKGKYLNEVLPQYLERQMFLPTEEAIRHDLLVYLEYEKNKETGKSGGGRTKTGHLRKLNWTLIRVCREIAVQNGIDLYVTPLNVSFSKVPDAPYVVHPSGLRGRLKVFRYFAEQRFVFNWYPEYAKKHAAAKLRAVVRYGEPDLVTDRDLQTHRDFIRYADTITERMGRLDTVFPVAFLFTALGDDRTLRMDELTDRCKMLYERLHLAGAHLEKVSTPDGDLRPVGELVEQAVTHLNTTPNYYIKDYASHAIITHAAGRFTSNDQPLQRWYANSISHLLEC